MRSLRLFLRALNNQTDRCARYQTYAEVKHQRPRVEATDIGKATFLPKQQRKPNPPNVICAD